MATDQFEQLIAECEKQKKDLDKMDMNIASLYAARCKKKPEDLLDLMKVGGWLSAKEALEWGFVDEITDFADEKAPKMSASLASDMAAVGMPIPNVPMLDNNSAFSKFINSISSLFNSNSKKISSVMNKSYSFICALLGISAFTLTDNKTELTEDQLSSIENHIKSLNDSIAEKNKEIEDLKTKLQSYPADESKKIVEVKKPTSEDKSDVAKFVDNYNAAKVLFDMV